MMDGNGRGSAGAQQGSPSPVNRRRVFYLSGFDPQGASRYHALYRSGAALQAAVAGYDMSVGARARVDRLSSRWVVEHHAPASGDCRTEYHFLTWDDIVRKHWPRSAGRVVVVTLSSTARLVANGVLWRVLQTSWPAFLALMLPSTLLLGMVVAATVVLGLCVWLVPLSPGLGAIAATACVLGAIWGGHALQRWAQAAWLMRSTSVILKQARGELPDLERRLDEFSDLVADAILSCPADEEILVVGHSSGAMLAASVAARAIRRPGVAAAQLARFGLLTLGECIPMLSYQPEAHSFRHELAELRHCSGLTWIDFTAPADGCCFALIDPTAVCDDGEPREKVGSMSLSHCGPKRLSPRFAELFTPPSYAAIRRDKYRCHFQYLMATERAGDYDYFAITSGTLRLADRFALLPSVTGFRQFQRFGSPRR